MTRRDFLKIPLEGAKKIKEGLKKIVENKFGPGHEKMTRREFLTGKREK